MTRPKSSKILPRKRTRGKYDKKSARIGFHKWNLFEDDEMEAIFDTMLERGFKIATEEYPADAWLMSVYEDESKAADIGVVKVGLPIGAEDFDNPMWTFTLTDLVEDAITGLEAGDGGPIREDSDRAHLAKLAEHLRSLAGTIDDALARK